MSVTEKTASIIMEMERLMSQKDAVRYSGPVRVGVDLGTANVVVAVLSEEGRPLGGEIARATVVRDGLVIDYLGAITIVKRMVASLEERLGRALETAATAIPPGTGPGDSRAIRNVVEAAGLRVSQVIDEPTAAAMLLGIEDGAVVDIGGGTTGISILRNGEVTYTADEPTGGTHFTLVIAGNYGIDFDDAEAIKLDPQRQGEVFPILVPVIEKVASIISRHVAGHLVRAVYLAGGTACLEGIEEVIQSEVGIPTFKPENPLLVTPLGIALSASPC